MKALEHYSNNCTPYVLTCTLARAWLGALEVGVQEGLESLRVDELGLSVGGLETCVEVIGKPPVHAHITVELAEVVVQHTSPCHRAPLRADYPQDYGPANKALVLPSRLMSYEHCPDRTGTDYFFLFYPLSMSYELLFYAVGGTTA